MQYFSKYPFYSNYTTKPIKGFIELNYYYNDINRSHYADIVIYIKHLNIKQTMIKTILSIHASHLHLCSYFLIQ